MKYHGKVLETFAEIFNKGLQLARENKEEAIEMSLADEQDILKIIPIEI